MHDVDNPVAQKVLYKQLTRLGFQVQCANNGLEAIDAWINHPPGHFKLGFFDHHMPKVSPTNACLFTKLFIGCNHVV